MTRPLPRWYRQRCTHPNATAYMTLAGPLYECCPDCGARWDCVTADGHTNGHTGKVGPPYGDEG